MNVSVFIPGKLKSLTRANVHNPTGFHQPLLLGLRITPERFTAEDPIATEPRSRSDLTGDDGFRLIECLLALHSRLFQWVFDFSIPSTICAIL